MWCASALGMGNKNDLVRESRPPCNSLGGSISSAHGANGRGGESLFILRGNAGDPVHGLPWRLQTEPGVDHVGVHLRAGRLVAGQDRQADSGKRLVEHVLVTADPELLV